VFAESDLEVFHMPQGEPHAEHVEALRPEGQNLGASPHQGARERHARLAQHAAVRIDADHPPGVSDHLGAAPRDQAGAGRGGEESHAPLETGPLQGLAAIHGPRAEIEHSPDVVVVPGGAVEQLVDERLPVSLDRVPLLQDRMRPDRLGHGRPLIVENRAALRIAPRRAGAPPPAPPPPAPGRPGNAGYLYRAPTASRPPPRPGPPDTP